MAERQFIIKHELENLEPRDEKMILVIHEQIVPRENHYVS